MLPSSTPSGLRTLAWTRPHASVIVQSVLTERTRSYLQVQRLTVGEPLRCLEVSSTGVWVETSRGVRLLMPWEHATAVQVEWLPAEARRRTH